jgi:hypothetical protein
VSAQERRKQDARDRGKDRKRETSVERIRDIRKLSAQHPECLNDWPRNELNSKQQTHPPVTVPPPSGSARRRLRFAVADTRGPTP